LLRFDVPSPIGHSLVGYTVGRFIGEEDGRELLYQVAGTIIMANLPDMDFLPGLLLNRPALFHEGIFHSLGFALLFSLVGAAIAWKLEKPVRQTFILGLVAYSSHLLLDMLQPDGRPPYGIPLLWPISRMYFISPIPILPGVHHVASNSATTLDLISGLLDPHNLWAIGVEVGLFGSLILIGTRLQSRKHLPQHKLAIKDKPESLDRRLPARRKVIGQGKD
jgi:inner membrane protein